MMLASTCSLGGSAEGVRWLVPGAIRLTDRRQQSSPLKHPINDCFSEMIIVKGRAPLVHALVGGEEHKFVTDMAHIDYPVDDVGGVISIRKISAFIDYEPSEGQHQRYWIDLLLRFAKEPLLNTNSDGTEATAHM